MNWTTICSFDDIVPGTGICARVGNRHVAVFRPTADGPLWGVDNIDPFAGASVMSRGLIVEHDGELWVASPLKKQRFRLKDGYCPENPKRSIMTYPVRVEHEAIQVAIPEESTAG